ncbi:Glyoxylase, beta-lactamase superfamily II [Chitinophaga rupis]|uniref:Glyoxylase, beta-lactamase superfamily II n=1 Tax=Chitinophaga rupis TaxID=573321 RepID=A0A1H7GR98_9BACT|nr:hypothetical protein [Chitinophaga rupis]SEK40037.1 Glyoxylase, beta-lactamase superfamily II [Chitinophaga rupis]
MTNKLKTITLLALGLTTMNQAKSQELRKAAVHLAVQDQRIKIYTLVAPPEMFANTSHVIELAHELIVVDGQFFAPYAQQLKMLTDSLKKPVTRFYISHDHPDHYLGFGDAFPDVQVYALEETKQHIEKDGREVLKQRQEQFGGIIAKTLNVPAHAQKEGKEVIDGVTFIFERSLDNEDAVSLVIKIPEVKTYIAQDIVYNKIHLFISGNLDGWRKALRKIEHESEYKIILPGHGEPAGPSILKEDLEYLDFVDKTLAASKSKEEYKSKILAAYPDYGGEKLIDIYLAYYLKKDWKEK